MIKTGRTGKKYLKLNGSETELVKQFILSLENVIESKKRKPMSPEALKRRRAYQREYSKKRWAKEKEKRLQEKIRKEINL